MPKLKFEDVRQEDIDSIVLDIMTATENKIEIPEDLRDEWENYIYIEIADALSEFFRDPEYRNYN